MNIMLDIIEESRLRIEDIESRTFNITSDLEDPQPNYFNRKKTECENSCQCILQHLKIFNTGSNITKCLKYLVTPYKCYLTTKEVKQFNELCLICNEIFNQDNNEHENILLLLSERVNNILQSNDQSIWRKIGFQTDNPRTDFRAGGVMSLNFILFFITNFHYDFERMLELEYFLFAVVAIKISVSAN
jgi:hypothetical protein